MVMAMEYEVTAIRKRPKNFKGLVGQEFVVTTLMNALKTGHIAHAYLFSGSRGVGKTSAARILARALNCPDESLMGTEESLDYSGAEDISKGTAIDVIEIDGASNTSVNDVRGIQDEILFPPQNSRYKIYIIDEVHMLSNSAFNALLKTIEEPPQYVIFIFATTEIHKVPATIRSRCQQFNFRLISREDISKLLKVACTDASPPISAEDNALFWIAQEAAGSMRDAYTILDQVASFSGTEITLEKIKDKLGLWGIDEMNTLVEHIIEENQSASIEYLDNMLSSGITVEQMIIDLSDYFRSVLFIQQGIQRDGLLRHPRGTFSKQVIQAFTVAQLEKVLEMLLQSYRDIRYTLNDRFELELLISRLGRIRQYFEPDEIIGKIQSLRESITSMSELQTETAATLTPTSHHEHKDPLPEPPEPVTAITTDMWNKIIDEIQSQSPTLSAIMKSCSHWEYGQGSLKLQLESAMEGERVKQNKHIVIETVKKLYNIDIAIEYHIPGNPEDKSSENPQIEQVKDIFNGEIIK